MKETAELKELASNIKAYQGHKDEKLRLARLEAEHRKTLEDIGDSDISDPAVQRRASEANLGIQLVQARLKKLELPSGRFEKIEALVHVESRRYNQLVAAARDAEFGRLVKAHVEFFDGDEAACRDYFKKVRPPHPVLFKFLKAMHSPASGPKETRDVIREASSFITFREKMGKELGL